MKKRLLLIAIVAMLLPMSMMAQTKVTDPDTGDWSILTMATEDGTSLRTTVPILATPTCVRSGEERLTTMEPSSTKKTWKK
jgi:hypothetical protein